jgi:hypothetical protein
MQVLERKRFAKNLLHVHRMITVVVVMNNLEVYPTHKEYVLDR